MPDPPPLKISLISNGPSARDYDLAADDSTLRMGVNWSVEAVPCHYWCFSDWLTFAGSKPPGIDQRPVEPQGNPEAAVGPNVDRKIATHADPDQQQRWSAWKSQRRVVFVEQEVQRCGRLLAIVDPPFWTWSGCLALGLAWWLRPAVLKVWGMDLRGTEGSRPDGSEANRTEDRWKSERDLAGRLLRAIRDQGATIEWHSRGDEII